MPKLPLKIFRQRIEAAHGSSRSSTSEPSPAPHEAGTAAAGKKQRGSGVYPSNPTKLLRWTRRRRGGGNENKGLERSLLRAESSRGQQERRGFGEKEWESRDAAPRWARVHPTCAGRIPGIAKAQAALQRGFTRPCLPVPVPRAPSKI